MSKLKAGEIASLLVERTATFGYFLSNGRDEVFLHDSDASEPLLEGNAVDVFLYQDHQGRLAATMAKPTIKIGTYGWAPVVEAKRNLGVFVDIGISKDMLVSLDEMPGPFSLWPKQGDKLFVTLRLDKKERLFATLADDFIIEQITRRASKDMHNADITGTVHRVLEVGSFFISEESIGGFVHESERKQEPRLGQTISGRIIEVKEDGTVNASLLPRKQETIGEDAEKILTVLDRHGGTMPYGDKTDPKTIKDKFNMSKAAFKRALGRLMKERTVVQENGEKTLLIK